MTSEKSGPGRTAVAGGPVTIGLLTVADEADLLDFELRNRAFFAGTVGDRGEEYFSAFPRRHRRLVAENRSGTSLLFVVRDDSGRVVGRVNLGDIHDGSAELGYRFAEDTGGRGYAKAAVALALEAAEAAEVRRLTAVTTQDNLASQRVLTANGFTRVGRTEPTEISVGGKLLPAFHFLRLLDART